MRNLLLCFLLLTPLTVRAQMHSINSRGTVCTPHENTEEAVRYARDFIQQSSLDAPERERMLELFDKATLEEEAPFLSHDEFDELESLAQASSGEHIVRLRHEVTGCIMQSTLTLFMHPYDAHEAIRAVAQTLDLDRLRANGVVALGIAEWQEDTKRGRHVLGFHYVRDQSIELSEECAYVIGYGFCGPMRAATPLDAEGFPFHSPYLVSFEPIFTGQDS